MSKPNDHIQQQPLRLAIAPPPDALDRLFQIFGDELIPLEQLRARYFRNMNAQTFKAEVGTKRIPLPLISLVTTNNRQQYVHLRHLAAYIEQRAWLADEELARSLSPQDDGQE